MRVFPILATALLKSAQPTSALSPLKILKNRFSKVAAPTPVAPVGTDNTLTDRDLDDVFAKNKEWIQKMKEEDAGFFDNLGAIHKPDYFWIGCADARVPANEIMGKPAGTVFVARNVANLVVNTDVVSAAAALMNVLFGGTCSIRVVSNMASFF